jgi:DNA-binding beta-propeller fold protein YncE
MSLKKLKIASIGLAAACFLSFAAALIPKVQAHVQSSTQPAVFKTAAPAPIEKPKRTGILVLDNCDEQFQGKVEYEDNLTLLDSAGKQTFRVSGFNNCESIGSSRMIVADPKRDCIWTIENVAHRIRRFDLAGKETLTIEGIHGSAIAVDPETGNLWVLVGEQIGAGKTDVYDTTGKLVASYDVTGWDIVYDRTAKAFWIAERKLTKISAAKGEVQFSVNISTFCASSVDVDPKSGAAWVAVREHPQIAGSSNRLLKFSADGKELAAIELGKKGPFRVSVDAKDQCVWVANFKKSIERFSTEGKSEAEFDVEALAVQVDPAGGDVWVATPTETLKMTAKGDVTKRVRHAGKTSQAWIASLDR